MQTRKQFLEKTFSKALVGKFLFGTKLGVASLFTYGENFTPNREDFTVSLIRGFKPDEDFLGKFRITPGPCLLSMMYERCRDFDYDGFRS